MSLTLCGFLWGRYYLQEENKGSAIVHCKRIKEFETHKMPWAADRSKAPKKLVSKGGKLQITFQKVYTELVCFNILMVWFRVPACWELTML